MNQDISKLLVRFKTLRELEKERHETFEKHRKAEKEFNHALKALFKRYKSF